MNRPSDENIFTDYLELIKNKEIGDIKYINHLFLAHLIFKNIDTNNFLSCSTIRSLIDIQFSKTRETMKQIIFIYLVGFYIPFVYNCIFINYRFKNSETELVMRIPVSVTGTIADVRADGGRHGAQNPDRHTKVGWVLRAARRKLICI